MYIVEISENSRDPDFSNRLVYQLILYFLFAGLMVGLNIGLQNLHLAVIYPWLEPKLSPYLFFEKVYLSQNPYDMPEIVGSIAAVGITYLIKFFLDKFLVFRKKSLEFNQTSREFGLYFVFAIFTTLENLGIQFILGILTPLGLNLRIFIALTCGYATKFVLDKKYSFSTRKLEQKPK